MFYAILGIVVALALFLIFRDDHDNSYNKSEKSQKSAQYQKEAPKKEFQPGPKAEKQSGPKAADIQGEAKKVMGMIGSIIEEVKKETAEPLRDIQKGVQDLMDEAKTAFDKAMNEAGQKSYWAGSQDGMDLSFLDNLDYYDELAENSETFDITGLRYHCTARDCGRIVGFVKPEPSNVHDNRAQAVIRSDGKLIGYIPRTQLDWYEDFNEENVVCPFVGEIEIDPAHARLIAEIKVIIPSSREYVEEEIEDEL